MEFGREQFRRLIAFSLFRQHVYHNRPVYFRSLFKDPQHVLNIMSVYRSQIGDSHIFENHSRYKELFQTAFGPLDPSDHPLAIRQLAQRCVYSRFQILVGFRGTQRRQMGGEASYVFGNGHLIVV